MKNNTTPQSTYTWVDIFFNDFVIYLVAIIASCFLVWLYSDKRSMKYYVGIVVPVVSFGQVVILVLLLLASKRESEVNWIWFIQSISRLTTVLAFGMLLIPFIVRTLINTVSKVVPLKSGYMDAKEHCDMVLRNIFQALQDSLTLSLEFASLAIVILLAYFFSSWAEFHNIIMELAPNMKVDPFTLAIVIVGGLIGLIALFGRIKSKS